MQHTGVFGAGSIDRIISCMNEKRRDNRELDGLKKRETMKQMNVVIKSVPLNMGKTLNR